MLAAPVQDDRVAPYSAPGAGACTDAPALCVRVPPGALASGDGKPMLHARSAADVRFTITLPLDGGDGSLTPGMGHWMSAQEFAERQSGGRIHDHPRAPRDAA